MMEWRNARQSRIVLSPKWRNATIGSTQQAAGSTRSQQSGLRTQGSRLKTQGSSHRSYFLISDLMTGPTIWAVRGSRSSIAIRRSGHGESGHGQSLGMSCTAAFWSRVLAEAAFFGEHAAISEAISFALPETHQPAGGCLFGQILLQDLAEGGHFLRVHPFEGAFGAFGDSAWDLPAVAARISSIEGDWRASGSGAV